MCCKLQASCHSTHRCAVRKRQLEHYVSTVCTVLKLKVHPHETCKGYIQYI